MNAAAEQIRVQLAQHGPLSFARFMELALYCPLCGYYETKEDTTGKRGDFYTSVSVGRLFGELLAFQFADWFEKFRVQNPMPAITQQDDGRFEIMEAGAHDGRLAMDILWWLKRKRPEIFERVGYVLVEPSPRRREWQRQTLAAFGDRIRWIEDLAMRDALKSHVPNLSSDFTVCFSNELLDALPVHRIGWDAKSRSWFEWGVALQGREFVWTRLAIAEPSSPGFVKASHILDQIPPSLLEVLPDGFITEVGPAAADWWREAAGSLAGGKLLTLDYGLEAEEFLLPQRANGTLRAYHRHRLSDDLLANPGEQDLTAHVNFTAIRRAGESAGLQTETDVSQSRFLTDIAQRAWREDSGFGPWTPAHTRQFQTLTHPNHLGRAFRVLVQAR